MLQAVLLLTLHGPAALSKQAATRAFSVLRLIQYFVPYPFFKFTDIICACPSIMPFLEARHSLTLKTCMPCVQAPTDLDRPTSKRLAALVLPGHAGPCVDFDAFLLLLMTEFHAGGLFVP